MFKLTDSAKRKIFDLIENEKVTEDETLFLRVSIGIACCGHNLNLALEEKKLKDDRIYYFDEVKILINEKDLVHVNDKKLDYGVDPFGNKGFRLLEI